jgi:rRNA maturation protein Nop10
MEEVTPERTARCPWCAEEILAAARKCKHCGEFLIKDSSSHGGSEPKPEAEVLASTIAEIQPAWHREAEGGRWRCAEHNEPNCELCLDGSSPPWHDEPSSLPGLGPMAGKKLDSGYTGRTGSRKKLSNVGNRTEYGLQCPKCGGTQFTA